MGNIGDGRKKIQKKVVSDHRPGRNLCSVRHSRPVFQITAPNALLLGTPLQASSTEATSACQVGGHSTWKALLWKSVTPSNRSVSSRNQNLTSLSTSEEFDGL